MEVERQRAERTFNLLLRELELGDLLNDADVSTVLDPTFAQSTISMIDYLLQKGEDAYQKAGNPPLKVREECLRILENKYVLN